MTTDLTIYQKRERTNFWSIRHHAASYEKILPMADCADEVLFITSFPPRECGIATYSKDLMDALSQQFGFGINFSVCALESSHEEYEYPEPPNFILNPELRNSFLKTAFSINRDARIKLVVIQHEFGFFAGNEKEFMRFMEQITHPIVLVFHTVLPKPNNVLKAQVEQMAHRASALIVMTKNAAELLIKQYEIPLNKVVVIPHGTHLVEPIDKKELKQQYQFSDKLILSTFGLLSSSKSIETTLDALPKIVELFPNVLFLILGKTHPNIVKNDGEVYREMLTERVKILGLENHVLFVNQYLKLPVLLEYLTISDIYLFTSKDPHQAVSGTFSYAVACGCPVVSTPIPHALEVLSQSNGIIFDFEQPEQLSKAVISLLENEHLRHEISSNVLHKMASTAWQNAAISHALLFQKVATNSLNLKFSWPDLNLQHVRAMTTEMGIIQFSKIAIPDIQTGYALDDNARALIAVSQHYITTGETSDLDLIETYLHFIKFCLQPSGNFLNYVNYELAFTTQNYQENLEDSNGRAIWALGYFISLSDTMPQNMIALANDLFNSALPHVDEIHSTRAMAFIIKGLHYHGAEENRWLLELFANRLTQMYLHERCAHWCWFEPYLTYGNSVLPEAMLCAYLTTHNETYQQIAIESFDFLLSHVFVNGAIRVVSNKGWRTKEFPDFKPVGGEQPIDVAYTIMTLEKFYSVFDREHYKQKCFEAFNWFLGDNHLQQIIYNPRTGGCYDGLEEQNVNLNQGAESTLSYLLARLSVQRVDEMANSKSLHLHALAVSESVY
jgi:glycosyltransferase involved in cell wall biosynthesis